MQSPKTVSSSAPRPPRLKRSRALENIDLQSPKTVSSSAPRPPRLVRSRALENIDSRAPRASARSTLSRGHEDGRDVWGDALEAASAGTPPMTPGPSSVAGASQRIATSSAPPTNSTSLFDAEAYIIRDYAYLTPPARGRRKRAHGGPHVATPWLPRLRKRVALEKGASGGRECSFASSGADRATARRGVCDSQLRRGVCDSQLRRGVCDSQATSSDAVCATASSDAVYATARQSAQTR